MDVWVELLGCLLWLLQTALLWTLSSMSPIHFWFPSNMYTGLEFAVFEDMQMISFIKWSQVLIRRAYQLTCAALPLERVEKGILSSLGLHCLAYRRVKCACFLFCEKPVQVFRPFFSIGSFVFLIAFRTLTVCQLCS